MATQILAAGYCLEFLAAGNVGGMTASRKTAIEITLHTSKLPALLMFLSCCPIQLGYRVEGAGCRNEGQTAENELTTKGTKDNARRPRTKKRG